MPYFSHKVHQAYSASGIKCGNRAVLFAYNIYYNIYYNILYINIINKYVNI